MTTAAIEQTTHWTLDPADTSVEFAVKTFWVWGAQSRFRRRGCIRG
jgi:polyisoprenoid-binding protein YceI